MHVDLAVILLNYRTGAMTVDCLSTLAGQIEPGIRVVVVDNDSGDGSADAIEAAIRERGWSEWASLLRSPDNRGFAAGNNLGISSIEAGAYLLLNSDTLVRPGALRSLREALRLHPHHGIIASGILTASGDPDHNCFRVPAPPSEFVRGAETGIVTTLLRRFDTILPLTDRPFEPGWVGFACVVVRREVIRTVGPLDEGFFMYFEDVDYCRRSTAAGWKILYWPEAKVVHLQGGSSKVTEDGAWRRRAPRYYYEARSRYYAKYYGRIGLWAANILWFLGRLVALPRELLGRARSAREHEGVDIWTNAASPMRPRHGLDAGGGDLPPSHDAPLPIGDTNANPRDIGLFQLLAEDYRTHDRRLFTPGFVAIALHRLGNARMSVRFKLLRAPLTAAYCLLFTWVNWLWGIDLHYTVRLGRRVRIWHHGGIVLGARAIGNDVHIRHNTTFGVLSRGDPNGKPIIGNRVDIGVGACVLGPVTVGDDSIVGANSAVIRDVPPRSVVMGVPARQASLRMEGPMSHGTPGTGN
jgi:hypothetical protein